MYLGGKVQILPHVGKDLWGGLAMHLEVKKELDFFPMWEKIYMEG